MSVVVTSWSGSTTVSQGELVDRVLALYGSDATDSEFKNRALGWLDESVNDLNYHVWESSRVVEQGIPLVEGQQWVMLSAGLYYKESQGYLVHNTDGDEAPLTFLPWVPFKRMFPATNESGKPSYYTIFNADLDGRVYFDVLIDEDTATDYTFAIEYYQRIPKVSSVAAGNSLEIPTEFENILLYGAFKRAAMFFDDAPKIALYSGLEREAYDRMRRADRLHPDADNRIKLIDEVSLVRRNPNLVYPY